MCQITYSNLNDPLLNSLMIYFLGTIGSDKHKDGCGFMCSDNKIWKTKTAARNILNFGEIIYSIAVDKKPIPFHIRYATWGIEVTDENAHPFAGKHYLLMHNGTLIPKIGDENRDKKKDSDSETFLKALDKATQEKKDTSFEEIFNSAMDLFYGKFAFVIRNKDTDTDYIIRGRTAELFISYLTVNKKKMGYIINTSKTTMEDSFKLFVNTATIVTGNTYVLSEPLLLEEETIFVAGKDNIKIVGKTKETTPPVIIKPTSIVPHTSKSYVNSKETIEVSDIVKLTKKVYEYLTNHSLNLLDYQLIVNLIAGISLLELTKEDLVMFTEFLIPKITASKQLRKKVADVLDGKTFPHYLYKEFNLEYPWPVNRQEIILQAIEGYKAAEG